MKTLTRIRLVNWHLFENTTINCRGTTYFIGINGAGKSTILDAIQFALVGGQRDVKFNQAAMTGSRRTLSSYIRGELGTEGQRFLRGDASSVVALEFANPDGSYFVHGAVSDAYEDNRAPEVVYFIVHGAALNDAWFFETAGQLFDTRAFRRHLEHLALPPGARAQVFTRLEDYRLHLLNRLGQLKETFPAKIVKGVAFSPLTNIRDFVHNYLLDENLVDVRTLQEQLETLRHFEGLVKDIRQRIAALDHIEELDQERVANRRRRITNGYVRRRGQGDTVLEELRQRRVDRDEAEVALQRNELARDGLQESLKIAQEALLQAQIALQTDTTATRQKALRAAMAEQRLELEEVRRRHAALLAALQTEVEAMQRLRDLLAVDGRPLPPALTDWTAPDRDMRRAQPDGLLPMVHALQVDLETLGHDYAEARALLGQRIRELREEGERLQREIAQLRTGDRDASYEAEAPAAARLRRLLRAELGLGAGEVIYLCQALRVPDERWQDAVEGVLGLSRFHLLVPPAHYDAAMRIYRARRLKDNLHGVGLPDSERILRAAAQGEIRAAKGNRLANEVEIDAAASDEQSRRAARAYVDLLLGGYVKCDTLEELRPQRTAVTRECFVRRNFSTSHLNPEHYRRWFIGDRAVPRQIEQRAARLSLIGGELDTLARQLSDLEARLSLTRDRVRRYIELERDIPLLVRLPELEGSLDRLQQELASLDTQTVERLQAEVTRQRGAVDGLQARIAALERAIGSLQNRLETLNRETLPRLEQVGAQAVQEANAFLLQEDAADMQEDVETEYARRRERQALETVLENATRYESDYGSAEQRSRDRLREAKHAYSLQVDFGYDDEEGAGRYITERQRYIDSELPDYEERVARQRALAEQELVENFIHRLREQIEDARSQLRYLNDTLSHLRFGGERFEFITSPAPDLRQVYDMIMDSQTILGTSLLENSDFRQRHQQGWDMLFEHLTVGPDDELAPELRRLQDYRNYLAYDIRIHYPNDDRALLSQISAKKSGGETTTPFYVAMAASFAQAYRLNQPRPSDTIRLALFDEAFGKMDTARTASALQFMVETGLQVILATPPDKAGGLLPFVDSVRTVVRQNNHSFVLEIDKQQVMDKMQPAE